MRAAPVRKPWYSDGVGIAALAALAIHVVVIALLVSNGIGSLWHPGPDTIEGSADATGFGGMLLKPVWHRLDIVVMDDWSGKPIDSAVVHDLVANRVTRTSATGLSAVSVRAGAMLFVLVTKRGFDPSRLRVPNVSDSVQLHMVRLARLRDTTGRTARAH
jgi:hypothetical protein